MPPSQTRSRSGCITCKSKRKKCDETRPNCQRCERAGLQCPGYAAPDSKSGTGTEGEYARYWTKPVYSIPPEERAALTRNPRRSTSSSSNDNGETRLLSSLDQDVGSNSKLPEQEGNGVTPRVDGITEPAISGFFDLPTLGLSTPNQFTLENEMWDLDTMLFPTSHASLGDLCAARPKSRSDGTFPQHTPTSDSPDFSDFQLCDLTLSSQQLMESNLLDVPEKLYYFSESSLSHLVPLPESSNQTVIPSFLSLGKHPKPLPMIKNDEEGPEDVKRVMFGPLQLDRAVESNSLPFILQSYASWIERVAFNPLKVAQQARDVIFKHFYSTDESRWTITLFANLFRNLSASKLLSDVWDPSYLPMISALLGRVHQNLSVVELNYGTAREVDSQELIKVLDNTLELVSIYYIATRMDWGLELMQKAAPLFRRACPDPPGRPIHLQSLLLQPMECLRHYAIIDVLKNVTMDQPMFFQYDTTVYPELGSSMSNFSGDTGMQWLHGLPDPIVIVFARINTLRQCPLWDVGMVDELEVMIRDFVPIPSVSPEPVLTIARMVVQECWRQVAYIYLYMVLCGDNSISPRVVKALSRFTKLLDSVKPGRVPDSFIMLNLIIAGVAAHQPEDRQTIRQRMIGVENFRYKGANALSRLELLWKETDELGRPAIWGDLKDSYGQLNNS